MGLDWTQIIIAGLGCSALTLVIEKLFAKKEDKAKAQSVEIGNGMSAMEFYKAIEDAVEKRLTEAVRPYEEKITAYEKRCEELQEQVKTLEGKVSQMEKSYEAKLDRKESQVCLRENCGERINCKSA